MNHTPPRSTQRRTASTRALSRAVLATAVLLCQCLLVPPTFAKTLDYKVNGANNDAEETAWGTVKLGSSDLELVHDGSNQTVGLRFTGVAIPGGARISAAYLQFQADETTSASASLKIHAELSPNAGIFAKRTRNISSRARAADSVRWAPPAWTRVGARGAGQRSPDLSALIQTIVDQPQWASGNAMVLLLTGTGKRVAESYNGNPGGAASLRIEFIDQAPSGGSAKPADFSPAAGSYAGPLDVRLASATAGGRIHYTLDGSNPVPGAAGTREYRDDSPPRVSKDTTIKAVVSHTTLSTSAIRSARYQIAADNGDSRSLSYRVRSGNDDAEEFADGRVNLSSSDLEMITDGSRQTVGLRFTGVSLPRNARVESAYLQFQTDEVDSTKTTLTISGQRAANAPPFVKKVRDVSSRTRTSTSIQWVPAAWTKAGQRGASQRTPDLAGVVQEIVAQDGWDSGNALVLIVNGSGKRVAESYNGSAAGAPTLHLSFTSGGSKIEPDGKQAPELQVPGPQQATVGKTLRFSVKVADDQAAAKLAADLGPLPKGHDARFDSASGVFTWTPRSDAAGSEFSVAFTATDALDSRLSDSAEVRISVAAQTPVMPQYRLMVSLSADRSEAARLQGQELKGPIYAFLEPATEVRRASFFIDDGAAKGTPHRVEAGAPFDLAGGSEQRANAFDLSRLGAGPHTVSVLVEHTSGATVLVSSAFEVRGLNGPSRMTLTWEPSVEEIDGYRVFYGNSKEAAIVRISELPVSAGAVNPVSPSVTYELEQDLGMSAGNQACFRVAAYRASAASPLSEAACQQF